MAESGEEKLLAVARHIAKTLGNDNQNVAEDIFQIFSNFDVRFSKEKLTDPLGCAALEQSLDSVDSRISRYVSAEKPISNDPDESAAFLATVDELIATIKRWSPLADDETVGACLSRAEEILQHAVLCAEEEFRSLMELGGESFEMTRTSGVSGGESALNSSFDSDGDELDGKSDVPVGEPGSGDEVVIEVLPAGTVDGLREIAKRMVAAGFGKECARVYGCCRREFLEESFARLGFRNLSPSEIQEMPWQDLEDEIERWINASNVAMRILFPSERRLCDRVFSGSTADVAFTEVCRGSAIQLLSFADAVAIWSRLPEQLFRVIDVFDKMRDLIPEFASLFSDSQYTLFFENEAIAVWKRLGEAIRRIFMELENLIRTDPVKTVVPGGDLHSITRYVMNYLRTACQSRQTLELVFHDDFVELNDYPMVDDGVQSNSSLSVQLSWIMELLESNLEAKSKIYKDPALCSVFMMNNERYIVQKAKDSELGTLLGDNWIRKHTTKVRQWHVSYQRSSWSKVVGFLKVESDGGSGSTAGSSMVVETKAMKEKLKLFNHHFEELCRVQSQWIVFDEQLREEIRISLEKILLPAYASFIGRFQNVPELAKHADKYVKYGLEDIGDRLNDLFQGSSGSNGDRN